MKVELKRIELTDELIDKSICFGDLYNKLNIVELLKGEKLDVNNVHACRNTLDHIYELFIKNARKDKRLKNYKIKYQQRAVSFDFLMYSPRTDEDIPYMTLVLYREDDREDNTKELSVTQK